MGVMPMQEDDGVQELYTRDHGTVKVAKNSWQDGGFHIVLSPNGVYQHINGLPVKNEKELRAAFGTNNDDALAKALNWFKNRHTQEENPPRPIVFRGDNCPIFTDGTVPEESDLYNFFSPGPVLSAAIVGLHEFRKRKESGKAPQELRKAVAPPQEPGQGGENRAVPGAAPAPSPAELNRIEALKAKERIRQAKHRAKVKAAKPAQAMG